MTEAGNTSDQAIEEGDLYYVNPYRGESEAEIRKIVVSDESKVVRLELDRTPFFPNIGGQPNDTGRIEGPQGRASISDVFVENGTPIHIGHLEAGSLRIGEKVRAIVDMDRRMSIMRNHTGQHILKGALVKVLGNVPTTSVRLAVDYAAHVAKFESDIDAPILNRIEQVANDYIMANVQVKETELDRKQAEQSYGDAIHDLYSIPSSAQRLRIVELPNWNLNACACLHCRTTGEVGCLKIVSCDFRRDELDIKFVTGRQALGLYQELHDLSREASRISGTNREGLIDWISNLVLENQKLQSERSQQLGRTHKTKANELLDNATKVEDIPVIIEAIENYGDAEVNELANQVLKTNSRSVVLLAGITDRVSLIGVRGDGLRELGSPDMSRIVSEAAALINGGGGGKPERAYGGSKSHENLAKALELARKRATDDILSHLQDASSFR